MHRKIMKYAIYLLCVGIAFGINVIVSGGSRGIGFIVTAAAVALLLIQFAPPIIHDDDW